MSRVRYVPDGPAEAESELVAGIRARRGGTLLNLDRLLLHSSPFAQGWNTHLAAVRGGLLLSPKLRELAICAVAVLNGADYELDQHAPAWLRAGATEEQLAALRASAAAFSHLAVFDVVEKAVLQLALEMTRNVRVSEATFERIRHAFNNHERLLVELVGVIATYNMVSRFLVALEIDPEKSR